MLDTLSTIGTLEEHIKNASRADVNFRRVDGHHPPAPTNEEENRLAVEELRKRVAEAAQTAADRIFFPATGQQFLDSLSREERRKFPNLEVLPQNEKEEFEKSKKVVTYRRNLLAQELENLVMMSTVAQNVRLHTNRATIIQPWWLQPFITLLVPKSDLDAHPNLQVSMIIHKHDDPEKRLRQFHDEFEFPMKRLRKNALESEHDLGMINYVGVVVNLSTE